MTFAPFEIRFTTETRSTRRKISYDPIGRRRLDHKFPPFGNRIGDALRGSDTGEDLCFEETEDFLFAPVEPEQIKNYLSVPSVTLW